MDDCIFQFMDGAPAIDVYSLRKGEHLQRIPLEGESGRYTFHDLSSAALLVEESLSSWGCELHALRYAGDDCSSEENLKWLNELGDNEYVQVAEFLSDFHSPVEGGGPWEADTEYTDWQWWLLTWGY